MIRGSKGTIRLSDARTLRPFALVTRKPAAYQSPTRCPINEELRSYGYLSQAPDVADETGKTTDIDEFQLDLLEEAGPYVTAW